MGDESLNRVRSMYTYTEETNLGSQSRLGKPCAKSKYVRRRCIEASYYGLLDPDRVGIEGGRDRMKNLSISRERGWW